MMLEPNEEFAVAVKNQRMRLFEALKKGRISVMTRKLCTSVLAVAVLAYAPFAAAQAGSVKGVVYDESGNGLGGVMVSAFDEDISRSITVFTQPDGSFVIDGLADKKHAVRSRLLGLEDTNVKNVTINGDSLNITMKPADKDELDLQRPGNDLFNMIKWDDPKDRKNFKMMCTYCHQTGTVGFRTPEEPVDWDTMVRRMQGFGGLYKHTQETLVQKLLDAYSDEAIENWPEWTPPPAPTGEETEIVITEWFMGPQDNCMIHDLAVGHNGFIYTVDMINDAVMELNSKTGEQTVYSIPEGKEYASTANPRKGPHSLETDKDGNMWITLALSGQMAKFDTKTKEFSVIVSSHPTAPRGRYPHSLRISKDTGLVWYTDVGTNSVFSLDPNNDNAIKEYKMLRRDQAVGGGQGEAGGLTPYGIDIAPNGMIWASKLNGNRIIRIDPTKEDGAVKEWVPPFTGPRRLHVSPLDGMVWVPAYGDGTIGRFDPTTETWDVFDLPDSENEIPYALNIHPDTGEVWICGTGSDQLYRMNPKNGDVVTYRLPTRVTYTREIEFNSDGSVWTCNSNYPSRHIENGQGSVVKLELDANRPLASSD